MARYSYDPHNRRIRKVLTQDPSTGLKAGPRPMTHDFIYDGWQTIAEYANGKLSQEFIFGSELDAVIAMIDYNSEEKQEKYFYQTDRMGSVRSLVDEAGEIAVRYHYDAYWKTLSCR